MIQNFPKQCAYPGGIVSMGWRSMESIIDISSLLFIWRILLLPMSNIYKILLINYIICTVMMKYVMQEYDMRGVLIRWVKMTKF